MSKKKKKTSESSLISYIFDILVLNSKNRKNCVDASFVKMNKSTILTLIFEFQILKYK